MNSPRKIIGLLAVIITLAGCSEPPKQPTELQKARIELQLTDCLISVNEPSSGEPSDGSFFDSIPQMTLMAKKLEGMTSLEKKWAVNTIEDGSEIINLEFAADETVFSCDFIADSEETWVISEVRRNNEKVFNKLENEGIKEAKRARFVKDWKEKGYLDSDTKYYEKKHIKETSIYPNTSLKVICDPQETHVEIDTGSSAIEDDVTFTFIGVDGPKSTNFDLHDGIVGGLIVDSDGTVGRSILDIVRFDRGETFRFISLMKSSISVEVKGYTFNMDDLSQVPCLSTAALEAERARFKAEEEAREK